MKRFMSLTAALLIVVTAATSCGQRKAKYVFLFIGDGMGFSHVSLTEAYKAHERGEAGMDPLCFTSFPVLGEAVTCSANRPITCSSAAGTALSTGFKTNNGMLGVDPDTIALTSISYKIHDAGYAVGIMSNVQINHATPASFYGHSASRSAYYEIGKELPLTGFEFFGGGGFIYPQGRGGTEPVSLYETAEDGGYTIAYGIDDFAAKKDTSSRILLVQAEGSDKICPYALGRPEGALTLPQIVESAVSVLERNRRGFFMMAEGGLIDWTAHGKDAAGTIMEILDFDQAIQVAYAFYQKHPKNTLIVVTADHCTGGLALGLRSYNYDLSPIDSLKCATTTDNVEEYMDNKTSVDEVNEAARIGWTTYGHTGDVVPVWAVGAGSQKFAGRIDNTDVPRRICEAMGIEF